jgi:murein DD-endopeptidase MepM/ murein hydrolase activator NlpD
MLLLFINNLNASKIYEDNHYKKYKINVQSITKVDKIVRRSSSNILKGLFQENKYFKKNKHFLMYLTYDKKRSKSFPFKKALILIGKYKYELLYINKYKVYYLTTTNPKDKLINKIFISYKDIFKLKKNNFTIGKPLKTLYVTSKFDLNRLHPVLHYRRPHYGIDYRAKVGTPVYATESGKVIYAGRNGSYGNFIKIRHKNGYKTEYAHLQNFYRSKYYMKNRWVKKGQVIGYTGNTGRSTGPHLHFGLMKGKRFVNPEMYYEFNDINRKIKKISKKYNYLKKNRKLMSAIKRVSKKIYLF